MSIAEQVYREVQALPEPAAQEVLDFAQFLRLKNAGDDLNGLKLAQLPVMAAIWDNDEDDVYNDA